MSWRRLARLEIVSFLLFHPRQITDLPGWTDEALLFLETQQDISSVCGILRERHPELSVYNWLCDQEWNGPVGERGLPPHNSPAGPKPRSQRSVDAGVTIRHELPDADR